MSGSNNNFQLRFLEQQAETILRAKAAREVQAASANASLDSHNDSRDALADTNPSPIQPQFTRASISLPLILKTGESTSESDTAAEELALRPGMILQSGVQASLEEEIQRAHETFYKQGLNMRKKVLGEEWVDKRIKGEDEFEKAWERYATEAAWGTIWTRPGLELKTRSMLNLAMLTALGKWTELGTHVRGAIRNGCTEVEIQECLLQATAYCGMPAGAEAFRTAEKALAEMEKGGEFRRHPVESKAGTG